MPTVNPDGSIQFEGDLNKLYGPRSGGVNAARGGVNELGAANRAARVAKYGAEQVGRMEAAGARFSGATPTAASAPTSVNPAPVAESVAAKSLSFGQRALNVLRRGGRGLGVATFLTASPFSAVKTAQTPTEEYERRFGVGPSSLDSPALRFGRDIALRAVGGLQDLGTTIIDSFTGGSQAPTPQAPATTTSAGLNPDLIDLVTGGAVSPERLIAGTGVPVPGQGAFKRTTRGNVGPARRLGVRGASVAEAPGVTAVASPAPAAAAPITAPQLGTSGGIFENLASFANEAAKARVASATENRALTRDIKLAGVQAAGAKLGIESENAKSARITALAAAQKAGQEPKKVVLDLQGNPVIVNTARNTALAPRVNQPITEADIRETMKKHGMTREQVLARLQDEGRI